jgi:hypothetical protein
MNPVGYHLTNVVLHAVNGAVFYLLARRLLGLAMPSVDGSTLRLAAATAALFFALHPLRVESVVWATERRDVLSGFFFLLTVLAYLRAVEAGGIGRRRWLAVSVGCYALALLSKSIVMTLPLVLIALDVYPLRRTRGAWLQRIAEKIPYLALAVTVAGIAARVASVPALLEEEPLGRRLAMALYSLWFYVEKTAVPVGLSPLYPVPARVTLLARPFLLSALAVGLVTVALWLLRRRWPAGLAAWVGYSLLLAPVSGLVHYGPHIAADRNSYLSCLGWALLVGAAVVAVTRAMATGALRPAYARLAFVAAAVWILGLAMLTVLQIPVWHDAEALWQYAVDTDPTCEICLTNLGTALERCGEPGPAIEHFRAALAINPDSVLARRNLGLTLLQAGRPAEASVEFRRLIERAPEDAALRRYLDAALLAERSPTEAAHQLGTDIRPAPCVR